MSITAKTSQDILSTPRSSSSAADVSQQLADLEFKLVLLQVIPPELNLERVLLKREINACCASILQLPPETLSWCALQTPLGIQVRVMPLCGQRGRAFVNRLCYLARFAMPGEKLLGRPRDFGVRCRYGFPVVWIPR